MVVWPDALVTEIAQRRAVIIVGAGASADCTDIQTGNHPPSWVTLLSDAAERFLRDADVREFFDEYMGKERYLGDP